VSFYYEKEGGEEVVKLGGTLANHRETLAIHGWVNAHGVNTKNRQTPYPCAAKTKCIKWNSKASRGSAFAFFSNSW